MNMYTAPPSEENTKAFWQFTKEFGQCLLNDSMNLEMKTRLKWNTVLFWHKSFDRLDDSYGHKALVIAEYGCYKDRRNIDHKYIFTKISRTKTLGVPANSLYPGRNPIHYEMDWPRHTALFARESIYPFMRVPDDLLVCHSMCSSECVCACVCLFVLHIHRVLHGSDQRDLHLIINQRVESLLHPVWLPVTVGAGWLSS